MRDSFSSSISKHQERRGHALMNHQVGDYYKSNKQPASKQLTELSADNGLSLGITTESASNRTNIDVQDCLAKRLDNNVSRYALQKIAQKYHSDHRINACMKTVKADATAVEVHYNDTERHAHYRNLYRCDNVWMCPVCSSRITSHRANEIRQAYANAIENHGMAVVMVTYTMRHDRTQDLQNNLDAMREARRKMRSGRKWQDFKRVWGYQGCISSLEVTYGWESGWHVHVHELMFLKCDATGNILANEEITVLEEQLQDDLAQWWCDSLRKVGRDGVTDYALKVDATDHEIAWYISKFGKLPSERSWDASLELTKSMQKLGGAGLHPFEILQFSDDIQVPLEERKLLQKLWYDYVHAFSGRRQTFWTNGLKDLLAVEVTEEDSDIDESTGQVFLIAREMWRDIVYMNRRAELLNVVMETRNSQQIINRWLKETAYDASAKRARYHERKE